MFGDMIFFDVLFVLWFLIYLCNLKIGFFYDFVCLYDLFDVFRNDLELFVCVEGGLIGSFDVLRRCYM